MQPLLESTISIRTKTGPGMTSVAKAVLYADHLELSTRKGEPIISAPLNQLENPRIEIRRRMIEFRYEGGYFLLIFTTGRPVFLSFLGAIGKAISLAIKPNQPTIDIWVQTLQQHGVDLQPVS